MSANQLKVADSKGVEKAGARYHPLFASPDGDIVLQASDATCFRVSSIIIRTALKFFEGMFSLPQHASAIDPAPIVLSEPADVLERMLSLVYHLPTPPWSSYEEFEAVVLATEKYQGTGILEGMCALVTYPFLIMGGTAVGEPLSPLQVFQIAAHQGWEKEARWASGNVLHADIVDPDNSTVMNKIPVGYLVRLVQLHGQRRRMLQDLLESDVFEAGNRTPRICGGCAVADPDDTWHILKATILKAIDSRKEPMRVLLNTMPEALRCWEGLCPGCGITRYNRDETIGIIVESLEELPVAI